MAEPQLPVTSTNLAYQGQGVNLNDFADRAALKTPRAVTIVSQYENYQPADDIDYGDLATLNREISALILRLHRIRIELKTAKRNAMKTKYAYEAEKKRVWIGMSGGSDKGREAAAELYTEELYSDYLVANAVADEVQQHSRDIRTELDALKEMSNNLRRQIDLR